METTSGVVGVAATGGSGRCKRLTSRRSVAAAAVDVVDTVPMGPA